MKREIVYLGHENTIDLLLKADGAAVDLSDVNKMTLTLGATTISSQNGADEPIQWAKIGYQKGEMRLILGDQSITAGNYQAPLVVYDPTNPEGIVWGNVTLTVLVEVENSPP